MPDSSDSDRPLLPNRKRRPPAPSPLPFRDTTSEAPAVDHAIRRRVQSKRKVGLVAGLPHEQESSGAPSGQAEREVVGQRRRKRIARDVDLHEDLHVSPTPARKRQRVKNSGSAPINAPTPAGNTDDRENVPPVHKMDRPRSRPPTSRRTDKPVERPLGKPPDIKAKGVPIPSESERLEAKSQLAQDAKDLFGDNDVDWTTSRGGEKKERKKKRRSTDLLEEVLENDSDEPFLSNPLADLRPESEEDDQKSPLNLPKNLNEMDEDDGVDTHELWAQLRMATKARRPPPSPSKSNVPAKTGTKASRSQSVTTSGQKIQKLNTALTTGSQGPDPTGDTSDINSSPCATVDDAAANALFGGDPSGTTEAYKGPDNEGQGKKVDCTQGEDGVNCDNREESPGENFSGSEDSSPSRRKKKRKAKKKPNTTRLDDDSLREMFAMDMDNYDEYSSEDEAEVKACKAVLDDKINAYYREKKALEADLQTRRKEYERALLYRMLYFATPHIPLWSGGEVNKRKCSFIEIPICLRVGTDSTTEDLICQLWAATAKSPAAGVVSDRVASRRATQIETEVLKRSEAARVWCRNVGLAITCEEKFGLEPLELTRKLSESFASETQQWEAEVSLEEPDGIEARMWYLKHFGREYQQECDDMSRKTSRPGMVESQNSNESEHIHRKRVLVADDESLDDSEDEMGDSEAPKVGHEVTETELLLDQMADAAIDDDLTIGEVDQNIVLSSSPSSPEKSAASARNDYSESSPDVEEDSEFNVTETAGFTAELAPVQFGLSSNSGGKNGEEAKTTVQEVSKQRSVLSFLRTEKRLDKNAFIQDEAEQSGESDNGEDLNDLADGEADAELDDFIVEDEEGGDIRGVAALHAAQMEEQAEEIYKEQFTMAGIEKRRMAELGHVLDDNGETILDPRVLARRKLEMKQRDEHSDDEMELIVDGDESDDGEDGEAEELGNDENDISGINLMSAQEAVQVALEVKAMKRQKVKAAAKARFALKSDLNNPTTQNGLEPRVEKSSEMCLEAEQLGGEIQTVSKSEGKKFIGQLKELFLCDEDQ